MYSSPIRTDNTTDQVGSPDAIAAEEFHHPGKWWHSDNGRVVCDLCPRNCALKEGQQGFCFVRKNVAGKMELLTYGHSTGFCIDPVEKKPLNHFYPGTSVLSFGTAGCNLGCKFCQAWEITKSHEVLHLLSQHATPQVIAIAAKELDCHSVSFTYNDPVIWAEYAIDTAHECHRLGLKTIAKTAGYINPEARKDFFAVMDAANVDLKGFSEHFYQHLCLAHLQPTLDTLEYLVHDTNVWLEITNLVIPKENDDPQMLRSMCQWIHEHLGDEVPLHVTAFHPEFRLMDHPRTTLATLTAARNVALDSGLKYVYTGNVVDRDGQSTYCPTCKGRLIERDWYELGEYNLAGGRCNRCGEQIAGHFADRPGTWGPRRLPVDPSTLVAQLGRRENNVR